MADTVSAVNGVYGTQYGQPAELAASTPSAPSHAASASQSTTTSATPQKADPTEIGWYFVEQYYTTLSKSPERIHLFYNKRSQLVTGNEAEKVLPAVGVKAISEKIKNLEIQDCKVRVLNVDSQASFTNIVVQVIGEMSNKNQPHHKFVQTFVLAEQPNGYFVLNDIFRYLSDDEDEIVDDEPVQPEVPVEEPSTPAESGVPEPAEEPVEETVTTEAAAEEVDQELEEVKAEDSVAEEPAPVNGEDVTTEGALAAETTTESVEEPAEPAAPEPEPEEQPAEPTPVEAEEPKAATPAPEAAAPTKKTWASMLGGGAVTAAAAPAVPALPTQKSATQQSKAPRPVSQAQPAKTTTPTEPAAAASSPTGQSNGWQMAGDTKKGKGGPQAKANDGNVLAYIKNVNEKVDARTLRETLERYGELKYFDVSRPRNCAFVEFATPEGYAAAVAANPHTVNTETISVEERRPRPGAYGGPGGQFARGSAQPGRGRGGNMQQRTGSQGSFPKDAGRGGMPQQRGNKSGTVTPRGGRGQAQAA